MEIDLSYAIGIILTYYTAHGYSNSVVYGFKESIADFYHYLAARKLDYSDNTAMTWLEVMVKEVNHAKFKKYRNAVYLINTVIEHGRVTSVRFVYKNSPPFKLLNETYRNDLIDFLDSIEHQYKTTSLEGIRRKCSAVFIWIQSHGAENPEEISHRVLLEYWNTCKWHISYRMKNAYSNTSALFIEFLENRYSLPETLHLVLNKVIAKYLLILDDTDLKTRKSFLEIAPSKSMLGNYFSDYNEASTAFYEKLQQIGYSYSVLQAAQIGLIEFHVFLEANNLCYSDELFWHWQTYVGKHWGAGKNAQTKRTIWLFSELIQTGDINPHHIHSQKIPRYIVPDWASHVLEGYLTERKSLEMCASTLTMDHSSVCRFLEYLDCMGISSFSHITPQLLVDFNIQDKHTTVQGHNAYNSRIRGFIRYLERIGLVGPFLQLAVPTNTAPSTRIVELLSDHQIESIFSRMEHAASPLELRQILVVSLGLLMGLRAIDIVQLKLSDIDWNNETVSLVQRKTGTPLVLPFPLSVGNLMYRYIVEARPNQTQVSNLIIKHRAPYASLSPGICRQILDNILIHSDCQPSHGFHVTRRQFATAMLRNDVPASLIAASLGHTNLDTLDPYLSMDEKRMRICAIELNGIEFQGDYYE